MDFLDNFDRRFGPLVVFEEEEFEDEANEADLLDFELGRNYRQFPRIDFINYWNDDEFFERFRLVKSTIVYVLSLIEDQLSHNAYQNRYVLLNFLDFSNTN